MALPTTFSGLAAGNYPASLLDGNFNAVGNMAIYRCTATGTNAITLTLLANQTPIGSYANNIAFWFIAPATTTSSPVTIQVSALSALNVYRDDGVLAGSGDLTLGGAYEAYYINSLNAGVGGFQLTQSSAIPANSTIITPNIVGVINGSSAATGSVGEIIEQNVASPGTSLSTSAPKTVASITLTPGDWQVWGLAGFLGTSTTSTTQLGAGISLVNNTLPTAPNGGAYFNESTPAQVSAAANNIYSVGQMHINVTTSTTVYLVQFGVFSVSTLNGYGYIGARRIR